ncbi:MBL fold metallo-hydrolase [Candidatus Thorarchaeota archaeon]|nr:MAG: MBL fold metallo-hydrolase [Candidatus Thorarchaeota archaeon]
MSYRELGPSFFLVIGGAFPRCNSLVIIDDEIVIVDPGCGIEDLRALLQDKDHTLKDIDTVILSHIHPDHITHATRLQRLSRCRIAANEITAPLFNNKEMMKEFLGFHKTNPVRVLWEHLVNSKMYGALDEGHIDEILTNGDKFVIGDLTLRTLYTPGHLPDHMCIEILEPNLVFAADIDLTEFGPYYGHPNSSIPEFKRSIRQLQHNDYNALISGHLREPVVEDYKTALAAYDRQIGIREDLVLSAIMNGAKTVADITLNPIIYPSLTDPVYLQFEIWMIEHHITSLVTRELIEEKNGKLVAI